MLVIAGIAPLFKYVNIYISLKKKLKRPAKVLLNSMGRVRQKILGNAAKKCSEHVGMHPKRLEIQ